MPYKPSFYTKYRALKLTS